MIPISLAAEIATAVGGTAAAGSLWSAVHSWLGNRDRKFTITVQPEGGAPQTVFLSGADLSDARIADIIKRISNDADADENAHAEAAALDVADHEVDGPWPAAPDEQQSQEGGRSTAGG